MQQANGKGLLPVIQICFGGSLTNLFRRGTEPLSLMRIQHYIIIPKRTYSINIIFVHICP